MFRDDLKLWQCYRPECMLGKQLRSWHKSTPGSPQHPYNRTDAKGALKDNGNYSAKQVWRSCFTNRRFSVAVRQCDRRDFPELTCRTFYPPDHACNDYFWQTLLLATGEYPVEVMFQQMPMWHLESLLLNVITLLSDLQRECAA
ncbi:conserved hypothetical protein [Trichinella spiralis]|uniref:hypothetical protein n=1 Tax=Trichinella spiralis TaxID=6334 RepID=UPI0001EFC147|nr:conserved hypothetical protein [Trichinella spiralis]